MRDEPRPFFAYRHVSGGRVVVEVGGECDVATLDELNSVLQDAVEGDPTEVVVDLAQATFVDSLTLGSLTATAKQVRANGGFFQVVGADEPGVRRVFEVTGLDRYLFAAR